MQHLHEIVSESVKLLTNTLYVLKLSWEVSTVLVLFKSTRQRLSLFRVRRIYFGQLFLKTVVKKKTQKKHFGPNVERRIDILGPHFVKLTAAKASLLAQGKATNPWGLTMLSV